MQAFSFLVQASLVLILFCAYTESKRDNTARCGACKAVLDELRYSISKEDKHKVVEGKQEGIKKIKYAGSEMHILQLLEDVCGLMQNYGETTDPKTGKKGYMRINSRDGETITISNVNFSSGGTQQLRSACEYFVSEHEEDIVQMIQLVQEKYFTQEEMEAELCTALTGYCRDGSDKHTEL